MRVQPGNWRRLQDPGESSGSLLVDVIQGKFSEEILCHVDFWRCRLAHADQVAAHLLEDFNLLAQKVVLQEAAQLGSGLPLSHLGVGASSSLNPAQLWTPGASLAPEAWSLLAPAGFLSQPQFPLYELRAVVPNLPNAATL